MRNISSKVWSSQLRTQFKQLRIEAWKSQDLNEVWTRDLAFQLLEKRPFTRKIVCFLLKQQQQQQNENKEQKKLGSCVVCASLDRYVVDISIDARPICRSRCRSLCRSRCVIGRYVDRQIDRYVGRYVDRCSTDMLVDIADDTLGRYVDR